MLSITGIKTHYYEGTSIIQSAEIIQKSIRVKASVQYTFEGHLIWTYTGGAGSRYRVRARRSLIPQSDLNLYQLCPELCRELGFKYVFKWHPFYLWSMLNILYQWNAYPGDIGSSLMGEGGCGATAPFIGLAWFQWSCVSLSLDFKQKSFWYS